MHVEHHLDHIGIGIVGELVDRMRGGTHAGARGLRQQLRNGEHQFGVNEGFIALHVDDDIVVIQAEQMAGFSQSVAAGGMVGAGQDGGHTVLVAGVNNGRTVAGHHHTNGHALQRQVADLLGHAHHHRHPGYVSQRFVGQAG